MAGKYGLTFTLAVALSAGAIAQERPVEAPRKDAQAVAASPLYQSAFAGYQGFREPAVMSWRAANDQVRDAGGMAGHDMSKMDGGAAMPGHDMSKMNDAAAATPGDTGATGTQKAMPAHDMGKMKSGAKGKMDMPGHDMSNMAQPQGAKKANRPAAPAAKVQATPTAMPGHDMANMDKEKPAAPSRPAPAASKKPAANAPGKMDHSKMNNKE